MAKDKKGRWAAQERVKRCRGVRCEAIDCRACPEAREAAAAAYKGSHPPITNIIVEAPQGEGSFGGGIFWGLVIGAAATFLTMAKL